MKIKSLYLLLFGVFCFYSCGSDDGPAETTDDDGYIVNPTDPGDDDETDPEDEEPLPDWKVGDVFFDENNWVECVVGDMPLVLSVPHGGGIEPTEIPDRSCSGITTVKDTYTIELARAIQKEMKEKYGKTPYIVFSHLRRTKVDFNRDLPEATCNNAAGNKVYEDYHNFLDTSVKLASKNYGRTLLVDLHATAHTKHRLEIGYALTTAQLQEVYEGKNLNLNANRSSLKNLIDDIDYNIHDLLMGDNAFGTIMGDKGMASVPSKQDPYAAAGEPYFTGGYISREYTNANYPDVSGWQIESTINFRNSDESRAATAKAFCESYFEFVEAFYP
ncbi:hypothetical protein [Sinomicrobium sp.]